MQLLQVCGLVAESHVIDESSEWRTFADSVSKAAVANKLQQAAIANKLQQAATNLELLMSNLQSPYLQPLV